MANDVSKPKWELDDHEDPNNIEHKLYEGYITEFNDISGIEIDYYIRDESIPMDRLYGESTNTAYLEPKRTKIIFDITQEHSITTGFGITSEDIIMFATIPRFTFSRDVSDSYEPKPGDVVKVLFNDKVYECVDVGHSGKVFQLKRKIWDLTLKPYRFSDQSTSADITNSAPISAWGDNEYIESASDVIDDYDDVSTNDFGY